MKEVTYNSSLLKDSWNSNETVKPNNFNELSGAVKNVIANANDLAHNYLQQGKQYVAGDIVYSKNLNKGCYLLCTQGGTTGDSEPQLINKNVGETVTDGTVVWTVQKVGNAQLNSSNTFTASNKFIANLAVSNGAAAGSQGQIVLGVKPRTARMQASIISSTTGALNYIATENTGHYFKIGNNTAITSINTNESETAIFSHNAFEFARITNEGVAKWLGNANTASKLETARTINGVEFDGTKDITIEAGGIVDSLLAQNGYVKFANGLILQWGNSVSTATDTTVTYPVPFTTLFSVIGVPKSSSNLSGSNSNFGIKSQGIESFIANMYDNGHGYAGFNWFAIGQ